jgi:hypothetical protein
VNANDHKIVMPGVRGLRAYSGYGDLHVPGTQDAPPRGTVGYCRLPQTLGGGRGMAWSWQFEKEDGTASRGLPKETFSSQGDAESWLGENWRELLDGGVDQVRLLDEERIEYGPMSLHPAS